MSEIYTDKEKLYRPIGLELTDDELNEMDGENK